MLGTADKGTRSHVKQSVLLEMLKNLNRKIEKCSFYKEDIIELKNLQHKKKRTK